MNKHQAATIGFWLMFGKQALFIKRKYQLKINFSFLVQALVLYQSWSCIYDK